MWQGKDSKRTFLLPAQFIACFPHPIQHDFPLSRHSFPAFSFLVDSRGGGGEVAVAILVASLSSEKKAGFSDINGPVGGMAGGVG